MNGLVFHVGSLQPKHLGMSPDSLSHMKHATFDSRVWKRFLQGHPKIWGW